MSASRSRTIDLFSLVLGAATIFLLLAMLSYHPADSVDEPFFPLNRIYHANPLEYPKHDAVHNWCGPLGALVVDMLLQAIGWGTYYLIFALGILTVRCLTQQPITAPFIRIFGWLTSLLGFTSLVTIVGSSAWNGPVIGPGGYVGALGQTILREHVATVGGFLLSMCALIGGLLLCTDYILFQLAVFATRIAIERSLAGRAIKPRRILPAGDPAVRIRGKKVATALAAQGAPTEWSIVDEDEEEEVEAEDETEYEDDEEYDEEGDEAEEEDADEDDVVPVSAKQRASESKTDKPRGLQRLLHRANVGLRPQKPTPEKPEAKNERQEVIDQLEEASRHDEVREYDLPSIELLQVSEHFSTDEQEKEVRRKAKVLEKTFQDFGFRVKVVEIETGPVIAQYEIELEAGLRLSKITSLADDLAIALRVPSVRIVAPIPGKNTVGIEVPNEQRQVVRLREVMEETNGRVKKMRIPLFLGKDVSGNPLTVDLSTLPHLLIAGRTGTGKSVCLNAIICSILMTRRPDEVRMLMIDPKMVELSGYRTLPHLMHPVVTDMRKAEAILAWAVEKMEERYSLLARVGVRHISGYNQLGEEELMDRLQPENDEQRASIPVNLPYIVIVADEIADLMMTSGKEVEQHIIRLAQKSRAVGIHLILATQKPTVDVITGLIKSNLPARIAFQVASRTDSRVVLDEMGADKLLGNGDMLFLWPGTSTLLRGQGTYLGDDEINKVVEVVSTGEQDFVHELVQLKIDEPIAGGTGPLKKRDDLYDSAVDIVIREGRGSVSLLQRCLGIGYGRAARLIDFMAEDGIVGTYNGSQAREVVITLDDWHRLQGSADAAAPSLTSLPPPTTAPASDTPSKPRGKSTQKTISMADWQADEENADDDGHLTPPSTKHAKKKVVAPTPFDEPAKSSAAKASRTANTPVPAKKRRPPIEEEVLDEDEEEEESEDVAFDEEDELDEDDVEDGADDDGDEEEYEYEEDDEEEAADEEEVGDEAEDVDEEEMRYDGPEFGTPPSKRKSPQPGKKPVN